MREERSAGGELRRRGAQEERSGRGGQRRPGAARGSGRLPWACWAWPVPGPPCTPGWAQVWGECCAGKPLPAASLAQWEAVTFLGGVPAHIFLSQIRAEACQEINSGPAMLLLSVLTQRALLPLLAPTRSSGLPASSPQFHFRLPVPQLQPQRCCWTPAPHSPAMGPPAAQEVIKETAKPTQHGVFIPALCLTGHTAFLLLLIAEITLEKPLRAQGQTSGAVLIVPGECYL